MRFEHLTFPPQWKDYWTKYPHGMTILESLIDWAAKTNELMDNVNNWNTYLDDFVATFDENLKNEVTETVQSWIDSGYIEVVISAALQTQIDDVELQLNNEVQRIDAELLDIESKNKNTSYEPLRIAFFYNYENRQDKINLLKNLGFNCVYTYKIAGTFFEDVTRTLKFLDQMLENGIRVILGLNTDILVGDDYIQEQAYIQAVESHPAIIGFHHADEPVINSYPKSFQITIYQRIKAITNKNVYMVDGPFGPLGHTTFYTDEAYDIYMCDMYFHEVDVNGSKIVSLKELKARLFTHLIMINHNSYYSSPKNYIPVLPFYSMQLDKRGLVTPDELKVHMSVYSLFDNIKDYGVFAFDMSAFPGDEDFKYLLESTPELQKMVSTMFGLIHRNDQEITTILPNNFQMHKNFISSTNCKYTSDIFDKISIESVEASAYEEQTLVYKVNSNYKGTSLVVTTFAGNAKDSKTRFLNHYYSLDGINYISCGTPVRGSDVFGSVTDAYNTTVTEIPKNINAVYVKVIMNSPTAGAIAGNTAGIKMSSASII